MQGYPVPLQRR